MAIFKALQKSRSRVLARVSTGAGKTVGLISPVVYQAHMHALTFRPPFITLCFVPLLALQAAHFSSLSSSAVMDVVSLHGGTEGAKLESVIKVFLFGQPSKSLLLLLSPSSPLPASIKSTNVSVSKDLALKNHVVVSKEQVGGRAKTDKNLVGPSEQGNEKTEK